MKLRNAKITNIDMINICHTFKYACMQAYTDVQTYRRTHLNTCMYIYDTYIVSHPVKRILDVVRGAHEARTAVLIPVSSALTHT